MSTTSHPIFIFKTRLITPSNARVVSKSQDHVFLQKILHLCISYIDRLAVLPFYLPRFHRQDNTRLREQIMLLKYPSVKLLRRGVKLQVNQQQVKL